MALKRKVDDDAKETQLRRRARGQEKEDRRVLVPKVLVWHCGGPHLQRDCPHINDEGLANIWSLAIVATRTISQTNSTTMELMVPKALQGQK